MVRKDQKRIINLNKKEFKKEILKIWVIKEALVKSHFGSILKDYDHWIIKNARNAVNKKLKIYRKIFHKRIDNWTIGLACDEDIKYKTELIELV